MKAYFVNYVKIYFDFAFYCHFYAEQIETGI